MASPKLKALLQRKIRMAVESFVREHRAAYRSQVDEIAVKDTDAGIEVTVGAASTEEKAASRKRKKSTDEDGA